MLMNALRIKLIYEEKSTWNWDNRRQGSDRKKVMCQADNKLVRNFRTEELKVFRVQLH